MRLENREQAYTFLIFLEMERLRHTDDIVTIAESKAAIMSKYQFSIEEVEQISAKAKDKWVDVLEPACACGGECSCNVA